MKLLTIGTARLDLPRQAGRTRLDAVHRVLRAAGWRTRHMAVYRPDAHDPPRGSDHLFARDDTGSPGAADRAGWDEVDAAETLLNDPERFARACALIDAEDPDILWLDGPWLWPFVRAYRAARGGHRSRLVYGATASEAERIAGATRRLPPATGARIGAQVRALEAELCRACDGLVARDPDTLSALVHDKPGLDKPSLLAPDGAWLRRLAARAMPPAGRPAEAVFAAPPHPQAAGAFVRMLGGNLACLAPDERIVVAGGVMRLLEGPGYWGALRGLNLARLADAGDLDAEDLADRIGRAHGAILPGPAHAGGLTLPEILLSRRPLVATTAALRGFEAFAAFPGVTVCDAPEAFRAAVKAMLAAARTDLAYTPEQERMLESLAWPAVLAPLAPFLESLVGRAPPAGTSETPGDGIGISPETGTSSETWTGARLRPLLARGWHAFEPEGTWSCARTAVLRLHLPQALDRTLYLRAHVEVFNPQGRPLAVAVFTPNGRLAQYEFRGRTRKQALDLRIAPADCDRDGMTELYFRSSALFSPLASSKGDDPRLLGLRVTALDIADAPLAASGNAPTHRLSAGLGRWLGRRF